MNLAGSAAAQRVGGRLRTLVMLLTSCIVACSPRAEPPLTEAERGAIEETILALWDQTLAGIEEVDAARAYSLFSDSNEERLGREE